MESMRSGILKHEKAEQIADKLFEYMQEECLSYNQAQLVLTHLMQNINNNSIIIRKQINDMI